MGKKKWCLGREDFVCLTKDCPYMAECIQVVWEKKVGRMISRMRPTVPRPEAEPAAEEGGRPGTSRRAGGAPSPGRTEITRRR